MVTVTIQYLNNNLLKLPEKVMCIEKNWQVYF